MSAFTAKALEIISSAQDPKQAIRDIIAPALPKIHVMANMVLVASYIRPEKTAGGILRPKTNLEEDQWQGKVGLILKTGPQAFVSDESYEFHPDDIPQVGDWVVYRIGDALEVLLNGTTKISCRMVKDSAIRMRVTDPEVIL